MIDERYHQAIQASKEGRMRDALTLYRSLVNSGTITPGEAYQLAKACGFSFSK